MSSDLQKLPSTQGIRQLLLINKTIQAEECGSKDKSMNAWLGMGFYELLSNNRAIVSIVRDTR